MKLIPLFVAIFSLILSGAGCPRLAKPPETTAPAPTATTPAVTTPVPSSGDISASDTKSDAPATVTAPSNDSAATSSPTSTAPISGELQSEAIVIVDDKGFSPNDVTVKLGGTVTWVNNANKVNWPASNPHPVHTNLPGFDSFGIDPGQSWTYTFEKTGNWGYHNHVSPAQFGVVRVIE